jgi:hypothetical protein
MQNEKIETVAGIHSGSMLVTLFTAEPQRAQRRGKKGFKRIFSASSAPRR